MFSEFSKHQDVAEKCPGTAITDSFAGCHFQESDLQAFGQAIQQGASPKTVDVAKHRRPSHRLPSRRIRTEARRRLNIYRQRLYGKT